MTKQAKITREMIDEAAFQLVQKEGFEAATARNVANAVGCSTQPIYKIYKNLEELKQAVSDKVCQYMYEKVYSYHKTKDPFLNAGLGYVNFAATEPVLYREMVIDNKLEQTIFGPQHHEVLYRLMEEELREMQITDEEKQQIYIDILVYTNGLATLLYSRQLTLTEEQVAAKLIRIVERVTGMEYGKETAYED